VDGIDRGDASPFETERSRRERVLLRIAASCSPSGFWLGLQSMVRRGYKETLEKNQNDSNLLQQSVGFKTVHDRHFYVDKGLYDISLEFGFRCVPALIKINRWRYAQTDLGPLTVIQKYCRTRVDLPKPADFRKKLARSGGISIQDDLLRPRLVKQNHVSTLNGILIHGPLSRIPKSPDFGSAGFICYAIPYDDYSDWAAILDLDNLVSGCQIQVTGGGGDPGNGGTNGTAPKWRKRPERLE
jgi:hypothetical protein